MNATQPYDEQAFFQQLVLKYLASEELARDITKGEIARQFYQGNSCFDDETLHRDYKSFIKRTVDSLPPRAREVFLLCREEGRSYDEIAAALGISRNAVRNSMHLVLGKFRDAAREEFGMTLRVLLPILASLNVCRDPVV
ncbi:MAG TPA: sigma factor-like helix-turn-helix DNA-binding protein [Puia sp.]|nr:sigma factor-like helix-turn-helix DNA-binding protein [Puia sp.]